MRRATIFERAARPFGLVAAALLVFLMVHTTIAVLGRQLMNYAMLSLVEVSGLVLMGIIFFAMPGVFIRDDNIVVDVIDNVVPEKVSRGLYILGLVMTLVFLSVAAFAMIEPAMGKFYRNQTTMVMEIDRFYYWIPILFGFYLAIAGTVWLLIHRLRGGGAPVPPPQSD
jgi:TRAP-type C4-dicarboxylate transport system permease small subunit